MIKNLIFIVAIFIVASCHSSKSVIVTSKKHNRSHKNTTAKVVQAKTGMNSTAVLNYISQYKTIAMSNMKNFNIPASIILAQGILESGAGQSQLATAANNHFGIKCYKDWKGETSYHDDDLSQECFRKYKNAEESYQDHADILSKRNRYASLFQLPKGDYISWAEGLKAAGYATDPNYPQKLINYIEQYQLHQYDNKVLGKKFDANKKQDVVPKNNQYEVQKGDTLYSISKKFDISIEELKKINNIFEDAISVGHLIFIK
jgi:flagellum-specific peptidoglycan hydrolase FlgJ